MSLVPFFKPISSADYSCFGPDHKIYSWHYDAPLDLRTASEGFLEFVLRETTQLVNYKEQMKQSKNRKKGK
jgi:hypothetical protein